MIQSSNVEKHISKVANSYSSILKFSVSPENNIYDGTILSKSVTCFEHIFKACYILWSGDDIDFDKTMNDHILNDIKKRHPYIKVKSLNKALGLVLSENKELPDMFYNVYCNINPERNNEIHGKEDVSQEAIIEGLNNIEPVCNWFFVKCELYNWKERFIDPRLRQYEATFMETLSKYIQNTVIVSKNIQKNFQLITEDTFSAEIVDNDRRANLSIGFYTKFNNSFNTTKRIVANNILIEPNDNFEIKFPNEKENVLLPFKEIISKSDFIQPLLVKIMAEGGAGKSTLLWCLIHKLCSTHKTIYFENADIEALEYVFESIVTNKENSPVVLFLDQVVTNELNHESLSQFGEVISKYSYKARIALVCTERPYRYRSFKKINDFERKFGVVGTINYSCKSIKEKVFQKVIEHLRPEGLIYTSQQEKDYLNKFNEIKSNSIIDNIFNLLIHLKQEYPEISYEFDWVDWEKNNKYKELNFLFEIVAFFYQFGVPVPIEFKNNMLLENINPLIMFTAIEEYKKDQSAPISIEDGFLRLRHEKIGEWFFIDMANSANRQEFIYNSFINDISDEYSAYIFRNLTENPEFKETKFGKNLHANKRIEVIQNYVKNENPKSEPYAKAVFYISSQYQELGHPKDAETVLEELLLHQPENVYAVHKLGQINFSLRNYDIAEAYYKKAFEKEESVYTIGGLYKLYDKTNNIVELYKIKKKLIELSKGDVNYAHSFLNMFSNIENIYLNELAELNKLWRYNLPFRSKLSQAYAAKENFAHAASVLTGVLKFVNPHDFSAYTQLGKLYINMAELPKYSRQKSEYLALAKKHLRKSLLINPENIAAHLNFSKVYKIEGDLKEAANYIQNKVLAKWPDNITVRNNLSEIELIKTIRSFTDNYDYVAKIIQLQNIQLFILDTIKLNAKVKWTLLLLIKVNSEIIKTLKNAVTGSDIIFGTTATIKSRNKNSIRLARLNCGILRKKLGFTSSYHIDNKNKAFGLNLAKQLIQLGDLTEAAIILQKIADKFPNDYEAGVLLIKIHIDNKDEEKANVCLEYICNSSLFAGNYISFIKLLANNNLHTKISYFTNLGDLKIANSFDAIEFSLFLYQAGKFKKSESHLEKYIIKHPDERDILKEIYHERTKEIEDFYLIDIIRLPSDNKEDIRKVLDKFCEVVSSDSVFTTKSAIQEKGIKVLKVINFYSKELLDEIHTSSLKKVAQAYFKIYQKNEFNLREANRYYYKVYETNKNDHELNRELINTHIELGAYQYQRGEFQKAIDLCDELQKIFPDETSYYSLKAKALRKRRNQKDLYKAISEYLKVKEMTANNLKRLLSGKEKGIANNEAIALCYKKLASYNFEIAECNTQIIISDNKNKININEMILARYEKAVELLTDALEYETGYQAKKTIQDLHEKKIRIADSLHKLYDRKKIGKIDLTSALRLYLTAQKSGIQSKFSEGIEAKIKSVKIKLKTKPK